MIWHGRSVKICFPVLCLVLLVATACADTESEAILKAARTNPLGQPVVLSAQLRANGHKVPFQIAVRDGKISYLFENPSQEIILGLGESVSTLEERKGGKTQPVAPARYDDSVRGGLLSYEDLAMRFLYWKNPKLLGEEKVGPSTAYKIEIQAPPTATEYGVVRVWVDKNTGALTKIEGYDRKGRLSKKFTVVSVQQIDGQWMLKSMSVERMDPEARKAVLRTYLDILGKSAP